MRTPDRDGPETRHAARRPPRIGLLGPFAGANLGDTAIQMAVIQSLRDRLGPVRFLGICTDPRDAVLALGIAGMATDGLGAIRETAEGAPPAPAARTSRGRFVRLWRRLAGIVGIYRVVGRLDLLVISGSGQVDDHWGGPWRHPYRLLAWSVCARMRGVPVAVFGIGVDELSTPLGAWFCVRALSLARHIALRDAGSARLLDCLGLRRKMRIIPDPAFGIRLPPGGATASRPYVLVCPISREAWPGEEDDAYRAYLKGLAAAATRLVATGLDVRFACTQIHMDPPAVARVLAAMGSAAAERCAIEPVAVVDDYLRLAGGAQLVVASRLHGVILALAAGAPVLAVSYSRKVRRLMRDTGLVAWCVDLDKADGRSLPDLLAGILDRREELQQRVASLRGRLRRALDSAHDDLLAAAFESFRPGAGRQHRFPEALPERKAVGAIREESPPGPEAGHG